MTSMWFRESNDEPVGELTIADCYEWYRITDYDRLDPFLVSVIAPSDQWLFVSSSGAVTSGRRNAGNALFAYETEDRLHRNGGRVGPFTLIRIEGFNEVWEPFAMHTPAGKVRRSIAKTTAGSRLRFQEYHIELDLNFSYTWSFSNKFGLIRTCQLAVAGRDQSLQIDLLDGLVDVLPAGVELSTQQLSSSLVDAYRRSELDAESGLALFTLESLVSDLPDPAESLSASVVWSTGLKNATIALSDRQIRPFRSGEDIHPEHLVTGSKGSFFVSTSAHLSGFTPVQWIMVADVNLSHKRVANLRKWLCTSKWSELKVRDAEEASHRKLVRLVTEADGEQQTCDREVTLNHFTNVLYNCMRGGLPVNGHRVDIADVSRFILTRNRPASSRFDPLVKALGSTVEREVLCDAVAGDTDLSRLVDEYLPLAFSRRHGDPSRPWNSFNIGASTAGGKFSFSYEGNWRDIFQNWEALIYSFPGYAMPVVTKFLNASTMDGYNPYRITNDGIEWEVPEEGSWTNFGYWGDHQIVYLHRLLDAVNRFHPGLLDENLHNLAYSYANVPYRILPYDSIAEDPKHTLAFDQAEQSEINRRVATLGTDGKLVLRADGRVHHVSLAEKLLVPALAKLSNLVPGGGIWLNTQRPEWNDANNALVGNGVSVVTVFHLREYLAFVDKILEQSPVDQVPLSQPVIDWLRDLQAALTAHSALSSANEITPETRRQLLDHLGTAFSCYRDRVYGHTPESASGVGVSELRRFLSSVRPHLDLVAASARRPDGLMEAYRLLRLGPGVAQLEPLYLMLEGQVAALDSSATSAASVVELIDNMFESELYRPDQKSFLLYPNKPLPSFLQKNQVPEELIGTALTGLMDAETGIVSRDVEGTVRFGRHLHNVKELVAALDGLDKSLQLDDEARAEILDAYEAVFNHWAFTGRSQTMYRYEGLGSVYWHMVAKLLLSLQERIFAAVDSGEDPEFIDEMAERYRRVRAGFGVKKTVAKHGAFPLDPYSHTPAHSGAQQPGPTGAVKEGILLRWGELGVRIEAGCVRFQPVLLDQSEFSHYKGLWLPLPIDKTLPAGSLGFTYCGTPVVYHRRDESPPTHIAYVNGEKITGGDRLDRETSRALFARKGEVTRIDVWVQLRTSVDSAG